jgi:hypothetical protein
VSIDQHISQTPRLIAEQHYTAATVDVDQPTGLGYVHIQKGTTANETLESKAPFEKFASSHGSSTKSRKQTSKQTRYKYNTMPSKTAFNHSQKPKSTKNKKKGCNQ